MSKIIHLLKILSVLDGVQNARSRFVGGCVRDFLLDGDNSKTNFLSYLIDNKKDIDIATSIQPDVVGEIFGDATLFTVKRTFVTNIVVHRGVKVEVTTLRKDVNPDGRWAQMEYAETFEEDSLRRDFTINAIYLEITNNEKAYKLYDYHNGIEDLKNGIVKFIGNPEQRIKEDYLRILRFFRFSQRFAKDIDLQALAASKQNADKIITLSKERIRDEFAKILMYKDLTIIRVMQNEGILAEIVGSTPDLQYLSVIESYAKSFIAKLCILTNFQQHQILLTRSEMRFVNLYNSTRGYFKDKAKMLFIMSKYGKEIFLDLFVCNNIETIASKDKLEELEFFKNIDGNAIPIAKFADIPEVVLASVEKEQISEIIEKMSIEAICKKYTFK